jgi:hypothetical protein
VTRDMDDRTPPEYDGLLAVAQRERAPLGLRTRLDADRERLAFRGAVVRRLRATAALAAVAAVAGIVIGLAVPGGGPTVLQAAALGAKPALTAAPAPRAGRPETLRASVGGVWFPTWGAALHWTAGGARTDTVSGRATKTVFYDDPDGVRLGYTIVDGDALPWPDGARTVTRGGVEVRVVRDGGRTVATWRVDGHTCVISAPASVSADRLVSLASVSTYG